MPNEKKITVTIQGKDEISGVLRGIAEQIDAFGTALKGLAIGYAVQQLASFVAQSVATEASLDRLSQKTGISIGYLSGLQLAAQRAGIGSEGLERGLKMLARTMGQAAEGNLQAVNTFAALGVKVTDAKGQLLPMDSVLVQIANRFAASSDGAQKAALAVKLFGRSGLDMIPVLDEGGAGLEQLKEKAASLGMIVSQDDADAIQNFYAQVQDLDTAVHSLALNFAEGLIPNLNELVSAFAGPGTDAFDAMREAGEKLGSAIKEIALAFYTLVRAGQIWGARASELFQSFTTNPAEAGIHFARFIELNKGSKDSLNTWLLDVASKKGMLFGNTKTDRKLQAIVTKNTAARRRSSNLPPPELANQYRDEMLRYQGLLEQEQDTAQLDATKRAVAAEQGVYDQMYHEGLITYEDYLQQKQGLTIAGIDAEIAALQKKVKDEEGILAKSQGPYKLQEQKNLVKLQDELQAKIAERNQAVVKGQTDQYDAEIQLRDYRLQTEAMVEEANDHQNETAIANIKAQYDAKRREAAQMGVNPHSFDLPESQAIAGAQIAPIDQQMGIINQRLQDQTQRVNRLVSDGQISQLDGQRQINELNSKAADQLQVLVDRYAALAKASGDPKLIANAKSMQASIDKLRDAQNMVYSGLQSGLTSGFQSFFEQIISGSESAAKAFENLGQNILDTVAQVIAKLIVMTVVMDLVNSMLSAFGLGITPQGGIGKAPTTTAVPGHANGGLISGGALSLVGERGPELFVPSTTGTVIPNDRLTAALGGGAPQKLTVQVVNQSSQPVEGQQGPQHMNGEELIVGVMLRDAKNNGPYFQAMKRMFGA